MPPLRKLRLFVAAAFLAGGGMSVGGKAVPAPDLSSMPNGEAAAQAQSLGLTVGDNREFLRAFLPGDFSPKPERRLAFERLRLLRAEDERRLLRRLPYGEAIFSVAARYRLDSLLLAAMVEAESNFDARVVSACGAVGLMQVLPEMARGYGVNDALDPSVNLDVGARYFRDLMRQFGGNVELALAAYNAGPGAVERYGKVPPFRETTGYIKKVLAIYGGHHQELRTVVSASLGPQPAPTADAGGGIGNALLGGPFTAPTLR